MAFPMLLPTVANEESSDDWTPTVKNTFITLDFMPTLGARRSSSVPPSSRLCSTAHKIDGDEVQSNVSTHEAAFSGSESGTRTPMSSDEGLWAFTSPHEMNVYPQNSWSTPTSSYSSPQDVCVYLQNSTPAPALVQVAPPPQPHPQPRLNSKAAPFHPQELVKACAVQPSDKGHKKNIAELIRLAKSSMKYSNHVDDVEVYEDAGGWTVVIKPVRVDDGGEDDFQIELLTTLAKEALLGAAAKSKFIYVMGYCSTQPFAMRAQGFEATLGAMQSATAACWHIFKKGFCRHGDSCCKQHPALQVPVNVLIEGEQMKCCRRFATTFHDQVAELALAVCTAVGEHPHVYVVEAFKDQGWTIELTADWDVDLAVDKEHLANVAKNAIFNASSQTEHVYVMGYASKPFTRKSDGFVTILGDMQDESKVCWDLYSTGTCSRDCECRWAHPECLMSLNVVVKERS